MQNPLQLVEVARFHGMVAYLTSGSCTHTSDAGPGQLPQHTTGCTIADSLEIVDDAAIQCSCIPALMHAAVKSCGCALYAVVMLAAQLLSV